MKTCQSCEEPTENKLTEIWNPFWILARSGVIKVCSKCLTIYTKNFPQILQGIDATDLFAARITWLQFDQDQTKLDDLIKTGTILLGSAEEIRTLGCKIVLQRGNEFGNEIWLVSRYSAVCFSSANLRVIELVKKLTGVSVDATK